MKRLITISHEALEQREFQKNVVDGMQQLASAVHRKRDEAMLMFLGGATACRSVYVEDSAAIKAFGNWLRHCGDKPRVSTVNRSVPSNGASSSSSSSHF